jgi:hypothetical protein
LGRQVEGRGNKIKDVVLHAQDRQGPGPVTLPPLPRFQAKIHAGRSGAQS